MVSEIYLISYLTKSKGQRELDWTFETFGNALLNILTLNFEGF